MGINGFTNPTSLGKIPNGWTVCPIESLCEKVTSGGTPLRSNPDFYQNGSIRWFKTKELNDGYLDDSEERITSLAIEKSSAKIFPPETVLMAMYGDGNTITSLGILRKESATNQACCALIVNSEVCDHRFLFYALKFHRSDFIQLATGGAQRNLSGTLIRNFAIKVPPLDEQKAIAHILGTLDDKIELNQQMNRTLEGIARALFKSWFIDFDPVRAKLDGGQPSGMDAETAALFPDAFEESAIGPIPQGWRVGNLEEIAEVVMGASPKGDTYNEEGIGTPLVNGPVEFGDHFVMQRKWTTAPTRLSQAGDLIFCVRGSTTGRRVIADDVFCLGRGVCAIRARLQQQPFINQLINTEIERLLAKTTGSVFPNLGSKDIKEFQIVIPSKALVDRYCKTGFNLTNQTYAHVRESATLASLRDALLPKLLSGEIRVEETKEALEAVA